MSIHYNPDSKQLFKLDKGDTLHPLVNPTRQAIADDMEETSDASQDSDSEDTGD